MPVLAGVNSVFRNLFRKQRVELDLDEEMRSHLALLTDEKIGHGMRADEAARAARLELGCVEEIKEQIRKARLGVWLETLWQDVCFGLRILRKNSGFTTVAVLSLALGIGANIAAFSLLNALLLRELPVRHPEQLVELSAKRPGGNVPFTYPMYWELERGQRVFSELTAWSETGNQSSVEVDGDISQASVYEVAGNYYSELGANPRLGRLIAREDVDASNGSTSQVAVLSSDFWRRRFGATTDVLGRVIRIEGHTFTIIGVTEPGFTGVMPDYQNEITVPLTAAPLILGDAFKSLDDRSFLWLGVTGRLRDGVTMTQARAQLESFWPALLKATSPTETPGPRRERFLAMSLNLTSASSGPIDDPVRNEYRRPLYVLLAIVGLILLLACANLANLMLARTVARSHEMSLRKALGASRWRLVRQALTESLLLSFAGALLGFAFAHWGSIVLVTQMTQNSVPPVTLDLRADLRVLGVGISLALLSGILFGLAPTWRASRESPGAVLRTIPPNSTTGTARLGKALIVVQVALSFILVIAAGLLVRTFQKLRSVNLGFEQDRILEVGLNPRPGGYQNLNLRNYRMQLIGRVSSIPGVRSATVGGVVPWPDARKDTVSVGSVDPNSESALMANAAMISPGFFQTLGIRLIGGRDFDWNDDEKHPPVAIISGDIADRLFPNGGAIGQRIRFGPISDSQAQEIVGIAGNARIFNLRDPAMNVVYIPALQNFKASQRVTLLIRSTGDPEVLARNVAHEVDSFGQEYVLRTQTASQLTAATLTPERIIAALSSFFAGLALLLASIGLFGLMSYTVARRTREIGIRLALGEKQVGILWEMLRGAVVPTLAGLATGIVGALGLSRFLSSILFGIVPTDSITFVAVSLLLTSVAFVACYIPARRATRVDPAVALRHE